MRVAAKSNPTLAVLGGLAAWIFWLRWPYFARPVWNLDEGIHAAVARSILQGGVMYRDAIDQRTPLTYYWLAGVFRIFGENNMGAVHALLAGMIVATALGVYLIGCQWRNRAAGLWAALIFSAFSTNLLYIGDTHSLCTEWFVIFFTTWSTWWFWRTWPRDSFSPAVVAGLGFAAAFLSKQPGILDLGAPLTTLVYAGATGCRQRSDVFRQITGLCLGFVGLVGLVFAWFWFKGALGDLYFYAWSYNLVYYGPETSLADRFLAAGEAARLVWRNYPALALILGSGVVAALVRLVQKSPTSEEQARNPVTFYALAWTLLAWIAAASAGRTYDHYYIQLLPAVALVGGMALAGWQQEWRSLRHPLTRAAIALAVTLAAWSVVAGPLRGPSPATLGRDAGENTGAYVRAHSRPGDKLFVWGYSPDLYLFADRRPASRFVYCSFITGMIPWTNVQPGRDTRYAIVPGTLETLLRELAANRPLFIVDSSQVAYRRFMNYPLTKFPRLAEFVTANYVEIEPQQFHPQSFHVWQLKDAARPAPPALAGGKPDGAPDEPALSGPTTTDPVTVAYAAQATHAAGKLQRLELLVDGVPTERVTFDAAKSFAAEFLVHFEKLGRGRHELVVRATAASGESRNSAVLPVECSPESLPADQRAAFALPFVGAGPAPDRVVSAFGAAARVEAGALVFFAHAPSVISYPLPAGAGRLRGRFGFRPGAYAPTNSGHTDGAEFVITLVDAAGRRTELFRHWLRPWDEPADQGEHSLDVALPAATAGARLELATSPGPANNSASDWTYWSDLLLSTSR